jgi:acylglycerol lipase
MMTPEVNTLITADNLKLHTVSWLPQTPPRAVVFIVHGYGEHIGRYPHVAEALVNAGFAVYGLDHRGHGKSEGTRAYFKTLDDAVNDYRMYFEQVRAKHPELKIFMYGHSMGSLIALAFALRYQNDLTGLALSGCAVNGDETVPGIMMALGKFIKSFAPTLPLQPGLPSSELSTDPAVSQAYDNDPLVYRGLWKVGMGIGLIEAGIKLRDQAQQLKLPLLIMHGEEDKITPISGSKLIYERATSSDKTLKTYPGMRHEIMNEREKEKPLAELQNWITVHLDS